MNLHIWRINTPPVTSSMALYCCRAINRPCSQLLDPQLAGYGNSCGLDSHSRRVVADGLSRSPAA